MDTPRWAQLLVTAFPQLSLEGFEIVDQPSDKYNCIAYAAGDTGKWWDHNEPHYWPDHAARSGSIASLKDVFAGLGFEQCCDGRAEDGYLKVALYEQNGEWEHAAAETRNGKWRSKMGKGPVIEHRNPDSLSGGPYGQATIIMRRAAAATP